MQRIRFRQPHMAIDPRAFVEPAVAEAGVHADDQKILAAVVQKVGDIEAEGGIAVVVAANEISVEEDERAGEGAIDLVCNAAAGISFGDIDREEIPPDAGYRIAAA